MRIYCVSFIGSDDMTVCKYYSSKVLATKEQNKLRKFDTAPPSDEDEDYRMVKCLFDMHEMECEISKTGVLKMLNTHFSELQ